MRRWIVRMVFWVCCGEWLLLQRFWMPPATFVALGLALYIRLALVWFLPHYAAHYYAWFALAMLWVFRFLRCFGKEARRKREHYEAPETGFPWIGKYLGVRPRRSAFGILVLEPVTACGIAVLLAALSNNALVIPSTTFNAQANEVSSTVEGWRGERAETPLRPIRPYVPGETPLPRRPQAPSSPPVIQTAKQASDIATAHLFIPVAALLLYNLTEWRSWHPRKPRAARRRARREQAADFFPRVRMHRHSMPGVSDVARMARRLARTSQ